MAWLGVWAVLLSGCAASPEPGATSSPSVGSRSSSSSLAPSPTMTPTHATPRSAKPEAGLKAVTVVMNGDLLLHNTLWFGAQEDARRTGQRGKDAYDFAPLLADLKPVISGADLAICHQEVPLAPKGGPYRNYPSFAAPPQIVAAIKTAGYDLCTTASNHTIDQGFSGLKRTLDDLDRVKIQHTGSARTQAEQGKPTIFQTSQGVKIAVVAGTFSLNGIALPTGKPWAVNLLDAAAMIAQAQRAKRAGADIVLAAMHAGTEYSSAENEQQVALAKALTASPDIDVVYGHHAHVVQPWTKVNNKWVIYGLGNLVAQHKTQVERGYEGVTARLTFSQRGSKYVVTKAEYIPTLITHYQPGHPARVYQISKALRQQKPPVSIARLKLAQSRTSRVVNALHPPGLVRS